MAKLQDWGPDTSEVSVWGKYPYSTHLGSETVPVVLDQSSFEKGSGLTIRGVLKNLNSMHEYTSFDRRAYLDKMGRDILRAVEDQVSSPGDLNAFVIVCYLDIKNHQVWYSLGYPGLCYDPPLDYCSLANGPEWLVTCRPNSIHFAVVGDEIEPVGQVLGQTRPEPIWFGFLDSCSDEDAFGWMLRNYVVLLNQYFPKEPVRIVALGRTRVRFIQLTLPLKPSLGVSGWQVDRTGHAANIRVDLQDPVLDKSMDRLNLDLIRWRIEPRLDLEQIQKRSCLVIGAGTLGCNVARLLLGWGISTITIVDRGKVTVSNVLYQTLYSHEQIGEHKALACASSLSKIQRDANIRGLVLEVPFPGCGYNSRLVESMAAETKQLVLDHDVIFLLTDSRESRWLPSLLGRLHDKTVISTALGFDSYVINLHGDRLQNHGCYFCTDIAQVSDSTIHQELDQQCTVTRPGISMIASGLAVELLASRLQTCLGKTPHQIRGGLDGFEQHTVSGAASEWCMVCSRGLEHEYTARGLGAVVEMLMDPAMITRICGIDKLVQECQHSLESE